MNYYNLRDDKCIRYTIYMVINMIMYNLHGDKYIVHIYTDNKTYTWW